MEDLLNKSPNPQLKNTAWWERKNEKILDTQHAKQNYKMITHENSIQLVPNQFNKKITLDSINQPHVRESYTLLIINFIRKIIAYLFNIYPHSIFSTFEKEQVKNKLTNKIEVNKKLLIPKLADLANRSYIKFFIFTKKWLTFTDHSMVIKKTGSLYSFFDQNSGEYINLTAEKLCEKINESIVVQGGTHMAFIDGEKYIKSLGYSRPFAKLS